MAYNQHNRYDGEPGAKLDATEQFVRDVLKAYQPIRDGRTWTATSDLYRLYRIAFANRRQPQPGDEDVELLDSRQFGAILNIVYPDCLKVKRRRSGLLVAGREGLSGPLSIRSTFGEPNRDS